MREAPVHQQSQVLRFIDWLLFSSMFAACCAVGLCMATERLLIRDIPSLLSPLHAFVFGSTLVVYNVHYLVKRSEPDISDLFSWTLKYKNWRFVFFALGALMCGISIFMLSWKIMVACVVLGVLSFAYSIPLLPFKNKKRLKDFGWVKILVLTSVWTIVTSVLPILYHDKLLLDYPYELMLRFVFMFTLCVAFDIRDMQTDLEADIYTLPNMIGVKNSYRLMDVALVLFVALSVIQYFRYPSVERIVAELLVTLCTKWAIIYTKRHPSDRAYLALVDGMMLVYAALVLLD